jgi:hypothetical protein
MSHVVALGVDIQECFPLREAARFFPRPNGKRISLPTLHRWASNGVRGARLETIRLGQQVCTSEKWIRQFIAAMNAGREEAMRQIRPADRELARRRQVDAALDAAGL